MNRREFMRGAGFSVLGAGCGCLGCRRALAAAPPARQRPLPKSEFDYVDWSWQRWREITGEARPVVTSAQSGKAELIDLVGVQAQTRRVLKVFLGDPPSAKADLRVRLLDETRSAAFIRRTVSYEVEPGERVAAYVLIPTHLRGRAPAMLCPHQTTQAGRKEPAGLAGNPELHTALRLVERGYVTLSYDALGFGERHDAASGHYGDAIPFYRRKPQWSLLGKMAWDLSRGLDYLQTLDVVDPQRIGSIGHSHGGITTLWGMALDERIRAGVSNCGFDTFRIDGNVWRWSHATALMPRLGFYVSSPHVTMDNYRAVPDSEVIQVPFDQHMMLALVAPRPLMLSTSDEDFVFPNGGWSARRSLSRLAPVYKALGAGDRLEGHFFSAGHSFPAPVSARAYEWLDRWLKA